MPWLSQLLGREGTRLWPQPSPDFRGGAASLAPEEMSQISGFSVFTDHWKTWLWTQPGFSSSEHIRGELWWQHDPVPCGEQLWKTRETSVKAGSGVITRKNRGHWSWQSSRMSSLSSPVDRLDVSLPAGRGPRTDVLWYLPHSQLFLRLGPCSQAASMQQEAPSGVRKAVPEDQGWECLLI